MAKLIGLVFTAVVLQSTFADEYVTDYIYWQKSDISAWHQFFPSRALQEELLTLEAAQDAFRDLASGLNDSLSKVVAFQAQELATAQLLMENTEAQGCVNGISDYMEDAIATEVDAYIDCTADAQSKLNRLLTSWRKTNATYFAQYIRTFKGIDACVRTYPNKDSISRLKSCIESMYSNYRTVANNTQNAMFPSPSMTYFQQTAVQCATTVATNVAAKGWKFLEMLVECSKLTTTIDPDAYAAELNQWQGYNDTLQSQISTAQDKNYYQVWGVEIEMQEYYGLQKQALEQYVIDSRGSNFYLNMTYLFLSDYYNTVTATALDNPGDLECTSTAKAALDMVANNTANEALSCDISIVNSTKELINEIVNDFVNLNFRMPYIGNVALLECFSKGYIFAPSTISDCFNIVYDTFGLYHSDTHSDIDSKVGVLQGYSSFYNGSNLPCGGSSVRKLWLGGDVTLYNLQRCLYTTSGTTYSVTTPSYGTTTELPPSNTTYPPPGVTFAP
ncbi:uncharacterized protein LOC128992203 [Macrosteles quadrilineatus]|uniref:uncharacterized protein LOC128992203 n=1 Tax=Macrosteles quadrilineatus TaxID=74068 RepID=UPI0023E31F46|nr:uncharacterized protein LOC128992203 [Macrosteles quadrilineatus]